MQSLRLTGASVADSLDGADGFGNLLARVSARSGGSRETGVWQMGECGNVIGELAS